MILAAGLTPAWQQIMLFERFVPGEVNRARQVAWCASGKVLNVGIALHHLGAESQTLALTGGSCGQAIQREFARLGVPYRFVTSAASTRICTTILDQATSQTTELVENAAAVRADEIEAFQAAYAHAAARASLVVLTGSLPAGTPATLYRDLLRQTLVPAILDVRGEELLLALEQSPFLIKPNREELERTIGRPIATDAELVAAMQELNRRGATWVVVTQGKHAVWATNGDRVYRAEAPAVQVVNPIACGDCLAAGLAWGIEQGLPVIEALRLGIAAAGENARQLLPARLDAESVRLRAAAIDVESFWSATA